MKVCKVCDKELIGKRTTFCSLACQRNRGSSIVGTKSQCLHCGQDFIISGYDNKKFCNHSCSAKYSNTRRGIKSKQEFCCICNTKLTHAQMEVCSTDCSKRRRRDNKVMKWLAGDVSEATYASGTIAIWAREYLLSECNMTCECGWNTPNPVLGRPILSIDHIDGDWTNNSRANLVVLCYNCHTLTPTFGSLNKGSKSGRRKGIGSRRNMELLTLQVA